MIRWCRSSVILLCGVLGVLTPDGALGPVWHGCCFCCDSCGHCRPAPSFDPVPSPVPLLPLSRTFASRGRCCSIRSLSLPIPRHLHRLHVPHLSVSFRVAVMTWAVWPGVRKHLPAATFCAAYCSTVGLLQRCLMARCSRRPAVRPVGRGELRRQLYWHCSGGLSRALVRAIQRWPWHSTTRSGHSAGTVWA